MEELKASDIERIKLSATYLNTTASGVLLAAVVAPFIGYAIGTLDATIDITKVATLSGIGLALSLVLHFVALWQLRELDR